MTKKQVTGEFLATGKIFEDSQSTYEIHYDGFTLSKIFKTKEGACCYFRKSMTADGATCSLYEFSKAYPFEFKVQHID